MADLVAEMVMAEGESEFWLECLLFRHANYRCRPTASFGKVWFLLVFCRWMAVMLLEEAVSEPSRSLTDEGHGNSILKNEQHVFTRGENLEKAGKSLWNVGLIRCFVRLNLWGNWMKGTHTTLAFRKTAACPASATLLSYRSNNLPPDAATSVKDHLKLCDFCSAELPLLAHHQPAAASAQKAPEIPMDLRILAESILATKRHLGNKID